MKSLSSSFASFQLCTIALPVHVKTTPIPQQLRVLCPVRRVSVDDKTDNSDKKQISAILIFTIILVVSPYFLAKHASFTV